MNPLVPPPVIDVPGGVVAITGTVAPFPLAFVVSVVVVAVLVTSGLLAYMARRSSRPE